MQSKRDSAYRAHLGVIPFTNQTSCLYVLYHNTVLTIEVCSTRLLFPRAMVRRFAPTWGHFRGYFARMSKHCLLGRLAITAEPWEGR